MVEVVINTSQGPGHVRMPYQQLTWACTLLYERALSWCPRSSWPWK